MGVYYTTCMILGWKISYQKILNYHIAQGLECICSNDEHIANAECRPYEFELINATYDEFKFNVIRTDQWFDCDPNDSIWYFGIELNDSKSLDKLKDFLSIPEASWFPNLMNLIKELGGDGDPKMYASLHVS